MAGVLIIGDTFRSPELRHEVPLGVPDPFVYLEHDGARHVYVDGGVVIRSFWPAGCSIRSRSRWYRDRDSPLRRSRARVGPGARAGHVVREWNPPAALPGANLVLAGTETC